MGRRSSSEPVEQAPHPLESRRTWREHNGRQGWITSAAVCNSVTMACCIFRPATATAMAMLGTERMPRIASSVVDEEALKLIREWIASPAKP